jgi:hypothetical protein
MTLPPQHRTKLQATNPMSVSTTRSNSAPKWPAYFPMTTPPRLIGAVLLGRNGEWAVQRARYVTPQPIMPLGAMIQHLEN